MIFISHSWKDAASANMIKQKLLDHGYNPSQVFLDSDTESGIPAGAKWEPQLYTRLRDCNVFIVLCSVNWQASRWCFAELIFAKAQGKAIYPILIEDCLLDPILAEYQTVSLPKDGESVFSRLFTSLDDQHFAPTDDFGWSTKDVGRCPYPGFRSFDESLAGVYFGREAETQSILEELRKMRAGQHPRFLMIVGSSGNGKSSLLKAGVLPRLKHKLSNSEWLVLPALRHRESANVLTIFEQIAFHLIALFPEGSNDIPAWESLHKEIIDGDLQRAADAFLAAARALLIALKCTSATLLIAIDQFEELLAQSPTEIARKFRRFLKQLFHHGDGRVLGIGTLRSDYLDLYSRCDDALRSPFLGLWPLPPFPRERIRDVICKPAKRVNVTISEPLIDRLISDTPRDEALPLLAFTLEKLYRRNLESSVLDLPHYNDLGGMTGSIKTCVAQILPPGSVSDVEFSALRLSFVKYLARMNENGEVVRRTARWADLPELAKPILRRFVVERLLTASQHVDLDDDTNRNAAVEIAHEAIFSCWDELKIWLNTSIDILRWRRDVERDQAIIGKWTGLRPSLRDIARDWPKTRREELTAIEIKWIRDSIFWKRIRRVAVAVIIAAISGLAVGFGLQYHLAEARQHLAEAQHTNAIALAARLDIARVMFRIANRTSPDSAGFTLSDDASELVILEKDGGVKLWRTEDLSKSIYRDTTQYDAIATRYGAPMVSERHFTPFIQLSRMDGLDDMLMEADEVQPRALPSHRGPAKGARFSPNGKFIVSWGGDNQLQVSSIERGVCMIPLHDDIAFALPNDSGRVVMALKPDGGIIFWDTSNKNAISSQLGANDPGALIRRVVSFGDHSVNVIRTDNSLGIISITKPE